MGKLFKLFALVLGTFTLVSGITSCKDDNECCSWTDDYGDSYSYCEDDTLPVGGTWALVQAAAAEYGGTCD